MNHDDFFRLGITAFDIIHQLSSIRLASDFHPVDFDINGKHLLFSVIAEHYLFLSGTDTVP